MSRRVEACRGVYQIATRLEIGGFSLSNSAIIYHDLPLQHSKSARPFRHPHLLYSTNRDARQMHMMCRADKLERDLT